MSNSFLNWTSRVAISGRVAERRRPRDELTTPGDYHLPFGKVEAETTRRILAAVAACAFADVGLAIMVMPPHAVFRLVQMDQLPRAHQHSAGRETVVISCDGDRHLNPQDVLRIFQCTVSTLSPGRGHSATCPRPTCAAIACPRRRRR